jgi:antitoxin component YwqK of YwqJK toxin-antitoxin module
MTDSASPKVVRSIFPNGALQSEYEEVDGQIEGYRRYWYPTGQLMSEAEFVRGVRHGQIREWTQEGVLTLSANRKHDELDGPYMSWWDDGTPKEQGEFKDGIRQPGYCWFHMDGTLWRKL